MGRRVSNSKDEMDKILDKLDGLPTLPGIVHELDKIISNPQSSASDVSKVLERDQSLAAKVLRMVNSAYYSIPGGISDLKRAITYLGNDTLKQLILTTSVFKNLNKTNTGQQFDLMAFWKHTVGVAMTAEALAKWAKYTNPSTCFTAGLLHDIGKVALYHFAPQYLDSISESAKKQNLTMLEVELTSKAVPHTVLGAKLARIWGLPVAIELAITCHHEPDLKKRPSSLSNDTNALIDIVYLANLLIHQLEFGNSGHSKNETINPDALKRIQIYPPQLPLIFKDINRALTTCDDFIRAISQP